jgi:hypothetical protein
MRAAQQDILKINESLRRLGMTPGVDAGQLLSDLIDEWGGTRNLAAEIKEAYDAAPQGSMSCLPVTRTISRRSVDRPDRPPGTPHPSGKPGKD